MKKSEMKEGSTTGFVLCLTGGILGIILGVLGINSGISNFLRGWEFGVLLIIIGIYILVIGVGIIYGGTLMRRDTSLKKGAWTSLVLGIISLNILAIIGGTIGLRKLLIAKGLIFSVILTAIHMKALFSYRIIFEAIPVLEFPILLTEGIYNALCPRDCGLWPNGYRCYPGCPVLGPYSQIGLLIIAALLVYFLLGMIVFFIYNKIKDRKAKK